MGPMTLRILGVLALVSALISSGYYEGKKHQGDADQVAFQTERNAWQIERDRARSLLDAADQRAAKAEHDGAAALAQAAADYERRTTYEKARSEAAIARLRSGADVLRVAVATVHRDCIDVSNAAAGAGRGDGQEVATLARPTAARLAGRYADYNAIVDQLALAQQVIATDRQICGTP